MNEETNLESYVEHHKVGNNQIDAVEICWVPVVYDALVVCCDRSICQAWRHFDHGKDRVWNCDLTWAQLRKASNHFVIACEAVVLAGWRCTPGPCFESGTKNGFCCRQPEHQYCSSSRPGIAATKKHSSPYGRSRYDREDASCGAVANNRKILSD